MSELKRSPDGPKLTGAQARAVRNVLVRVKAMADEIHAGALEDGHAQERRAPLRTDDGARPSDNGTPAWLDRSVYNVLTIHGARGTGKSHTLAAACAALRVLGAPQRDRSIRDALEPFGLGDGFFDSFRPAKLEQSGPGDWRVCRTLDVIDPTRFEGAGEHVMEQVFAYIDADITDELRRRDTGRDRLNDEWTDDWRELAPGRSDRGRQDAVGQLVQLRKELREDVARGWIFTQRFGQRALQEDSAGFREYVQGRGRENRESAIRHRTWRHFLNKFLNSYQQGLLVVPFDDCDLGPNHMKNVLDAIRTYLNYERVVVLLTADLDAVRDNLALAHLQSAPALQTLPLAAVPALGLGGLLARTLRDAEQGLGKVLPTPDRFDLNELSDKDVFRVFSPGHEGDPSWHSATWLDSEDGALMSTRYSGLLRLYPLRDLAYLAQCAARQPASEKQGGVTQEEARHTLESLLGYSVAIGTEYDRLRALPSDTDGFELMLAKRGKSSFAATIRARRAAHDVEAAPHVDAAPLEGEVDVLWHARTSGDGRHLPRRSGHDSEQRQAEHQRRLRIAHTAAFLVDSQISHDRFSAGIDVRVSGVGMPDLTDPIAIGFSLEHDLRALHGRPGNLLVKAPDRLCVPWNCRLLIDFFDILAADRLGSAIVYREQPLPSAYAEWKALLSPRDGAQPGGQGAACVTPPPDAPPFLDLVVRAQESDRRAKAALREVAEWLLGGTDEAHCDSGRAERLVERLYYSLAKVAEADATIDNALFLSDRRQSREMTRQGLALAPRTQSLVHNGTAEDALGRAEAKIKSILSEPSVKAVMAALDLLIGLVQPIDWLRGIYPELVGQLFKRGGLLAPLRQVAKSGADDLAGEVAAHLRQAARLETDMRKLLDNYERLFDSGRAGHGPSGADQADRASVAVQAKRIGVPTDVLLAALRGV